MELFGFIVLVVLLVIITGYACVGLYVDATWKGFQPYHVVVFMIGGLLLLALWSVLLQHAPFTIVFK